VLTGVKIEITVSWDVTPCIVVWYVSEKTGASVYRMKQGKNGMFGGNRGLEPMAARRTTGSYWFRHSPSPCQSSPISAAFPTSWIVVLP
jgi:hypothetical protein